MRPPRQGPVAAYSFDEGEGTTVEDVTGDGHTATVEGAEWTPHGHYGGAMQFDGEGCVTVPNSPGLELREELTVEAWIRPEGTGEAESIVFKEAEGEFFGYSLFMGLQASGRVEGLVADDAETEYAPTVTSPHEIPDGVWTHVALTYDGAHERLYVNGELVDTEAAELPIANKGPLRIGCVQKHEDGFDGRIDEVRIYDRALSGPEVDSDMEAPIQTPRQGPVAAYSFDEGEGTTVEDVTGDGHTATVEGAEWTTHGKYGGAMEFDGGSSCVSVPSAEGLQLDEEFTLEAWVRPQGSLSEDPVIWKESGGGVGYALGIALVHDGKAEGIGGEAENVISPETLESGVWTHLAVTDDGAHLRLYVDGELVATSAVTPEVAIGSGPLYIGCDGSMDQHFQGRIDQVRLYDRALSSSEVAPDVTRPTPPSIVIARYEDEEEPANTYVTWTGAEDPPGPTGLASGVRSYVYRYRLPGEAWGSWTTTEETGFSLEAGPAGTQLTLDIASVDAEGNESQIRHLVLESVESSLTPENVGEADPENEIGDPTPLPEPELHPGDSEEEESEPDVLGPRPEVSGDSEKLCPETTRCGRYDGPGAAAYARQWTFPGRHNQYVAEHHNMAFKYFGEEGGDCTNFASQALWAGGGMKFLKTEGHNDPHEWPEDEELKPNPAYHRGVGSWWSGYWHDYIGAGEIAKDYRVTESWDQARTLYRHLIETGLARVLSPSEPIHEGDLIFFDLYHGDNTKDIDHTEIVSGVYPKISGASIAKGYVFVSQHSEAKTVTLHEEFVHVYEKYGKRGEDWEAWFVRPIYTEANIEELELE